MISFLTTCGLVFLPSCNSTINIPSAPMGLTSTSTSTSTNTKGTPTSTPTGSTTVTPTDSSTTLPTATWTPTYTLTGSPTPTPNMTGTNTMTVTSTPTGCDKTCFGGSGSLPTVVPNGGSVTVLDFTGSAGCGSNTCTGNTYYYQVSSMSFTVVLTGNLSTEITGVHLWAGGVLVGSTSFNASGFSINFSPLSGRYGPFQLIYDLSSNASGTIQTNLSGVAFLGSGYAIYLPFAGPTLSIGGATPTGSPTSTSSPTFTPTGSTTTTFCSCTATSTFTTTATSTGTATPCATKTNLGDVTAGAGTVSPYGMTQAQQYTLSRNSTVKKIWIQLAAPATVRVGIYNNYLSTQWPGTLLYVSSYQAMNAGLNSVIVPDVPLTAGTYWLAYESNSGSVTLAAASGSTALHANVWLDFPCNWLACGYTSCNPPTPVPVGPGTPTPAPTPVCTPPPSGTAVNQGVLYAEICH